MIVYLTATMLSILFAYMAGNIRNSKQFMITTRWLLPKIFCVLSFLILTGVMAVRYNVGTDFRSYIGIYKFGDTRVEVGFQWFNKMLHLLSDDPQIFVVFSSILICGGFFIIIYRESIFPVYSILLFVIMKDYFMSMNTIRQYMATAIALFAIPYIKEKEWKKVFVTIFLSCMFHKSAVVFFFLYFLFQFEIPPATAGTVMLGIVVFSNVVSRFLYPILVRFDFYAGYFQNAYANSEHLWNRAYTLAYLSFFILLSSLYKKIKHNSNLKLLYTAVIMGTMIYLMEPVLTTNAHRVAWHLDALLILYIPETLQKIDYRLLRKLTGFAIVGLYTFITIRALLKGNQDVLPYQTFWQVEYYE